MNWRDYICHELDYLDAYEIAEDVIEEELIEIEDDE